MKKLAITGHLTRGKEVIKLLEILGGKNDSYYCSGESINNIYFINDNRYINSCHKTEHLDYFQLSLEEFEEKFPYKVEDKVHIYVQNDDIDGRYDIEIAEITSMRWNSARCKIAYKMKDINREFYKEEIKCKVDDNNIDYSEKGKYNVEKYLKLFDESEHGLEVYIEEGYDIKEIDGHFYIVKQKPTYPKTYEECCDILKIPNDERYIDIDVPLDYNKLLSAFTKLLICRDAYWKIAGKELGLNKPWELCHTKKRYVIRRAEDKIVKSFSVSCVLEFPTHEMRDTFYENFKDLIEKCKKLL